MKEEHEKELISFGKQAVALQLMINWFNTHEEAKKSVKESMLTIFTKDELFELFGEEELERAKQEALNKEWPK